MSDHDGKVGIGHPDFLDKRKLYSEEEEKKIDEKGNIVVDGQPWSRVHTGLYLTIFGYRGMGRFTQASETIRLPEITIAIGSGSGKPMFPVDGWGASLELPSDLARDEMKKQYLTEWVIETAKEILEESKAYIPDDQLDGFAAALMAGTEKAIRETGL